MRKLLLFFLCVMLLTGAVCAAEAVIDTMDTQCNVADDGSVTVTINTQLTFHQPVPSFVIAVPAEAERISVSGCSYSSSREDGYRLLTASGAAGFSGTQSFVITYRLLSAAIEQTDGQLLQLPLLSPGWEYAIEQFSLTVSLPKTFDATPTFQSGYYNDLIDNYMDIQVQDNTLTATLTQAMMDHESLMLTMTLPGGFFDLRFRAGRTAGWDITLFFLLLGSALVYWFLFVRGKLPIPKPLSMPPVGSNAGALCFQLFRRADDFGSMVLHWAAMGYLIVARSKDGRILLKRQLLMGNERKAYEAAAFHAAFGGDDVCFADSESYRRAEKLAAAGTAAYWDGKLFRGSRQSLLLLRLLALGAGIFCCLLTFDRLFDPTPTRWIFILLLTALGSGAVWQVQHLASCLLRPQPAVPAFPGLLSCLYLLLFGLVANTGVLALLNLLFQLTISLFCLFGSRRTKGGNALLSELLGLRRFLRTTPPQILCELQALDPHYFYQALPYAAALCVSRPFSRSFGNTVLEPCTWLLAQDAQPTSAADFTRLYREVQTALNGTSHIGLAERLLIRLSERRRNQPYSGF